MRDGLWGVGKIETVGFVRTYGYVNVNFYDVIMMTFARRNAMLRWKQNKTHCLVLRIKSRTLNLRKPPTYQPIEHSKRVLLIYFEPM